MMDWILEDTEKTFVDDIILSQIVISQKTIGIEQTSTSISILRRQTKQNIDDTCLVSQYTRWPIDNFLAK